MIGIDENCIKLSLQTYMPMVEGISCLQRVEDTMDASVLNHELLIEVLEGTMTLKDIQVLKLITISFFDLFVTTIVH